MTQEDAHPLPLDSQLCFALYGASMEMTRAYRPLLEPLGITYPQYLVLHTLWEADGRTVGAIAERLALDPSTVTPLLKRLEAGGLIARRRDARDERNVRVYLTTAGAGLRAESACVARKVSERTGLALDRIAALTEQLRALRGALADKGE